MKFRIPRKEKKKLKKRHFFYPPEKDGSILHAQPHDNQEEYDLYKSGELNEPFTVTKKEAKLRQEEFRKKFHKPVDDVPESKIIIAVGEIFNENHRFSAITTLLRARFIEDTKVDFYTFMNAYNLTKSGEGDYGNICCMAVDSAKEKLKKQKITLWEDLKNKKKYEDY
jgi:hypothetical protein